MHLRFRTTRIAWYFDTRERRSWRLAQALEPPSQLALYFFKAASQPKRISTLFLVLTPFTKPQGANV